MVIWYTRVKSPNFYTAKFVMEPSVEKILKAQPERRREVERKLTLAGRRLS